MSVMLCGSDGFAQPTIKETVKATSTTTTTTSTGTVSQFGPETIVVRTTTSTDPVGYSYTKTTTYVDEDGKPVSIETVKSGDGPFELATPAQECVTAEPSPRSASAARRR